MRHHIFISVLSLCLLFGNSCLFAFEYHVSKTGNDNNKGTVAMPLKTIQAAAERAFPGDTITVHAGTYREWINPKRGGNSNANRILYRTASGEEVYVKGSEVLAGWKKEKGNVWKIELDTYAFGDNYPLNVYVEGDWFADLGRKHHTSDIYLDGVSLFEAESLEKVKNPEIYKEAVYPEQSKYTWYAEHDGDKTVIYANFGSRNPNRQLVEISVRPTCFYPENPFIDYITVRGFDFSQAATQWGAPTAGQIGMIATHWNKGWIIEKNTVHDTKCSGITLGKERSSGHNVWSHNRNKDGSLHYIEVTFNALRNNWDREHIGSHIIRQNIIYNCEQTGICGSMGCAFSEVYDNHIYNIYVKRQFAGAEIGGIKFHAAIDTKIMHNRIHQARRAIWLDWMAQGTRVSCNLLYDNSSEDLFVEVNHGPFLVDNNFMLSSRSIRNQSEGGAYVHNLIAGDVYTWPETSRYTPYHLPHSTQIKGLSVILMGDDRFINNVFLPVEKKEKYHYGLKIYDSAKLPVLMDGNIYYNHAQPSKSDINYVKAVEKANVILTEDDGNVYLEFKGLSASQPVTRPVTTELLGKTLVSEAWFEQEDGSSCIINTDYFGNRRDREHPVSGPLEKMESNKIKVF